ncbi:M13 family metallopeptidase [Galactobacter caseinivorans]|uniref:M13 family peptidase n=1 Tax=Galactobacter caseinivorans TaxID=2676123 RepID=A0A496PGN5_9MICC|nr:M13-type metalloendopeptidase [Galactobacter caseinivorans]RKW69640.1 M13 family peptidase [Galactobacter caseinivorans]
MSEAVSAAARPQDDLYRSVNHEWLSTASIPGDRGSYGAFEILRDQSETDVLQLIEEAAALPADQANPLQARIAALWSSFMDQERIEAAGAQPLQEVLAGLRSIASKEELVRSSGELFRAGVSSFVDAGASSDAGDPNVNLFTLLQGGIGLPDESYYREESFAKTREDYQAHLVRLLTLIGEESPETAANAVVQVETAIASHHWDAVKCRDAVARYNRMSAEELLALMPALSTWFEGAGIERRYWDTVDVWQPDFLQGLQAELDAQPLQAWVAWLSVQYVRSRSPFLSSDFVTENWSFYSKTLGGATEQRPRWKRGVAFVEGGVGEDVGQLFVDRHFPPRSKELMDELVAQLLEAYRVSITELGWMSPETREKALDKLAKFRPKIGYPVKWIDYSPLELSAQDVLANAAAVAEFEFKRELKKIDDGVDKDLWFMFPQTVNAYYHPLLNEIAFPAAILRPPFFDADRDAAANFGGIGAVIGHEIGHGFDDQGSQFDGDGALNNWWSDEDRAAYEERTVALVAQYETLVPPEAPEHHVNGKLTLGENIGDLGGLGIAYKAYRAAVAAGGGDPEDMVDGVSGDQRFFEAWAGAWAVLTRPETMITRVTTDPHSPGEFRANQVPRNLDAFHAVYGTKEGDGMWLAPEARVSIW